MLSTDRFLEEMMHGTLSTDRFLDEMMRGTLSTDRFLGEMMRGTLSMDHFLEKVMRGQVFTKFYRISAILCVGYCSSESSSRRLKFFPRYTRLTVSSSDSSCGVPALSIVPSNSR